MRGRYEVSCTACDWSETHRATAEANRAAGGHYEGHGHAVRVEDTEAPTDAGLLSVCRTCGWTYAHGASHVDERRVDGHREGDDERHEVALLDLRDAVVLRDPTTAPQAEGALPVAETLRNGGDGA